MGKSAPGSVLLFFVFGTAVAAIVSTPFLTHAAVVYSQLSNLATSTNATVVFYKIPAGTSVQNGVKFIDLLASTGGISHAFQGIIICRRFSDYTGPCPELPDFTIVTASSPLTKTPTIYHLPFTSGSTTPLSSSRFYAFGINRTGGDSHGIQLRGVTTTNTCVVTGCGMSGTPYVILYDALSLPTLTFTASPANIIEGATSTLSWTSENATSCAASSGWSGERATTSSEIVSPIATTTYALTCTGAGGATTTEVTIGVAPPAVPDPVIIIPGILGSEQHNGEWIIDPILHTYDDLIATLDVNHYTPGVDLFTFPYDWRTSNVETALALKLKIDAVKGICGCDKVDLVAHSMGGLVARQYIQSVDYDQDVDQLIFLGTPHLGAPKAYLMWEGGEISPINDIFEEFSEKFLEHEAYEKGYPSLFAYIHAESIDSIRELLPTYDYLFDNATLRHYPSNYPQNSFLDELNDGVDSLLNSGIEIHNIIGNTNISETITALQTIDPQTYLPLWQHGYPDGFYNIFGDHGLIRSVGDKTVPIPSASFVNKNLSSISSVHQSLPDNAAGNVYQILTGDDAAVVVDNWNIPNLKIILFQIFSPVDLILVAPDGKKAGKNTSESERIPGSFYSGFDTDTEYITILNPLDGEYKIINQGTGTGQYTVEATYISEATTTEASYTGNTSLGLVTELNFAVDNTHPEDIEIIPPDLTPPTITIISPEAKDYLRSAVLPVQASAEDTESGVRGLETRLDGTLIPNTGSIDLFYKPLGTHLLIASSTDNAGNATTSARTFRVVANATSTLLDIERVYALGWVTKKISDDLSKKLKACNVKKTTVTNVTKTVVVTGKDGKTTTKKITEKVTKVEIVFDKNCAKAILKELDKYRNKGLNEQGYQLLKEDILWLINN